MNVVFQYEGNQPQLRQFVLRIPKTTLESSADDVLMPQETFRQFMNRSSRPPAPPAQVVESIRSHKLFPIDPELFHKNIVRPLIHKNYSLELHSISVGKSLLKALDEQLQQHPRRKRRGSIVSSRSAKDQVAYLVTDATRMIKPHLERLPQHSVKCVGSPLCVEIKPKCGALGTSRDIMRSRIHHPIQSTISRFEMHQYWKWKKGKVLSMSSFKPQQFFGRNFSSIRSSIRALCETPQNNLNVIVPSFGKNSDIMSAIEESGCFPCSGNSQEDNFASTLARVFAEEPLLSLILHIQEEAPGELQALEALTELIRYAYEKEKILTEGSDTNHLYREAAAAAKLVHISRFATMATLLRGFLIGKCFKDCSLMLNIQRVETRTLQDRKLSCKHGIGYIPEGDGEHGWFYTLSVADADPRDLHCIPYYEFMEREILNTYLGED